MKKIAFIFSIFVYGIVLGQVPQKLSYQAVIRDASNNIVSNQPVGIRISIMQGSPMGTPVYIETHNPMTNTDGLVSIEIAGGVVVSGAFSTIDWSKTPYFLFAEVDPTGGASYSIFSTTELMSVPYALFAERTRSPGPAGPQGVQGLAGTNGQNGVGVNNAQVVNDSLKITLTNGSIINSGYVKGAKGDTGIHGPKGDAGISITNTQVINDSLKVTLSNGSILNAGHVKGPKGDTGNSVMNVQVVNDSLRTTLSNGNIINSGIINNKINYNHYIGQYYGGGIVFHLWKDTLNNDHGLIVSLINFPWDAWNYDSWNGLGSRLIGTSAQNRENGLLNSNAIVSQVGHTNSVAKNCLDLVEGTYNDWYLPSIDELGLLYSNRFNVNVTLRFMGISPIQLSSFWSSTEYNSANAYYLDFNSGNISYTGKNYPLYYRAIRSF